MTNEIILPVRTEISSEIFRDICERLNIPSFMCSNGRYGFKSWKFPNFIALTSCAMESRYTFALPEEAKRWVLSEFVDLFSLDFRVHSGFEYDLVCSKLKESKIFSSDYREESNQIFGRGNNIVVPITQNWFCSKNNTGFYGDEKICKTSQREVILPIPPYFITKSSEKS